MPQMVFTVAHSDGDGTQMSALMYAPRSVMQDAALQHTQQFQDDPHEQKYGGIDFDAGPPCFADDAFNLQLDL
jgi:hypothetical protein